LPNCCISFQFLMILQSARNIRHRRKFSLWFHSRCLREDNGYTIGWECNEVFLERVV
jgi:hypothetical protein